MGEIMSKILQNVQSVFNMEEILSRILQSVQSLVFGKEARILLVGLDNAGKATFLYKFKMNQQENTLPAIGFSFDEVSHKNIRLSIWDVGGCQSYPPWKGRYPTIDAVIFLVDSADSERFGEARVELQKMLNDDQLRNAPFLLLANKQAMPKASPVDVIVKELQLTRMPSTRRWRIEPTDVASGQGVYTGLNWLSDSLKSSKPE
eukprot:CAMPEP_0181306334 /NCGR_PEP_ID=MMETSP1101-20121128/10240_1 /TAXON_ID=46948 /ORGANISM="Rhodomonas abbreviata, Strain Caron Lab Isolate" /LENGTH=203 /DNA_ID=CAMNT_0023412375 /DNA_START=191 /DNA_END=802 /DNA_ORIENTATION=+